MKLNEFWSKYNAIISTIISLLGVIIAYGTNNSERHKIIAIVLSVIGLIATIYFIFEKFNNYKKIIKQFESQVNDLKGKPKSKFDRFETIKKNGILKYGFIKYKPFFWTEGINHNGIGKKLLDAVFGNGVKLVPYSYPVGKEGGSWNDIFEDLCKKPTPTFDIIITPLFETRSRLYKYNIAYCSPIFYSNIGIYVRQDLFDGQKRSFKDAIHYINSKQWKPEILMGELSEMLVEKYFPKYLENVSKTNYKPATDDDFIKILQNINTTDPVEKRNNNLGDFAFMEVFKADSIVNQWKSAVNFNLVNILKDNELMYPVSFVVRKEDTILKNLINIRLLELRANGELEKIIRAVAKDVHIVDDDQIKNIFIQGFDFDNLVVS